MNLKELLDYEGCFDGRDAAGCDEENVGVSLAPASHCGEVPCHVYNKPFGPGRPLIRFGLLFMDSERYCTSCHLYPALFMIPNFFGIEACQ
jgi:hypothetical protein